MTSKSCRPKFEKHSQTNDRSKNTKTACGLIPPSRHAWVDCRTDRGNSADNVPRRRGNLPRIPPPRPPSPSPSPLFLSCAPVLGENARRTAQNWGRNTRSSSDGKSAASVHFLRPKKSGSKDGEDVGYRFILSRQRGNRHKGSWMTDVLYDSRLCRCRPCIAWRCAGQEDV